MAKKIFQILAILIFFLLIMSVQTFLIASWPAGFNDFDLALAMIFFVLFFFNLTPALWVALAAGFWLDTWSFYPFGLHIFLLLSLVYLINFLLHNWLTNRSVYSFLVLAAIGVFIYNLIFYLLMFLFGLTDGSGHFFLFAGSFWQNLWWQLGWNVLLNVAFFNLINSLSRRFKPFFLEKKL